MGTTVRLRVPSFKKRFLFLLLLIPPVLAALAIPQGPCIASHLVINEMEQNPSGLDVGNEWVELYNPTTSDVSILAWAIQSGIGERQTYVISEMTVPAFGYLTVTFPSLFLNNVDESVALIDRNGNQVDSTPQLTDTANDGRSWQRIPDALESAAAWHFLESTKASQNARAQSGIAPSWACNLTLRISLATLAAFGTFLAFTMTFWPSRPGEKSRPTRGYAILFSTIVALFMFEFWERVQLHELEPIQPLKDLIIAVLLLAISGEIALLWKHSSASGAALKREH